MILRTLQIAVLAVACTVLPGQVIPGWHVLELGEPTAGKVRGAQSVRAAQAAVRQALADRFGSGLAVVESTEVVMNALVIRSPLQAADLAVVPGVKRVWPVYEVSAQLNQAAVLQSAVQAWEAVGGIDKAGAGIKIGIIDSGIDGKHPGFAEEGLRAPEGFPKASSDITKAFTNGKVIVYRSYDSMQGFEETGADRNGHGTAVAMVAAGRKISSPIGEIQGIAPAAWLGVYKVFGGPNGASASTASILKGIDDAVADGMDVINLSNGIPTHVRPEFDPVQPAVDRAASFGVMVVKAAGNSGPNRFTVSSPYVGRMGLTVGAAYNSRLLASGVKLAGGSPVPGQPGSGPKPEASITAKLFNVESMDPTGRACLPLTGDALRGAVALVFRGDCPFEVKANNAAAAGAVAILVYNNVADLSLVLMNVGEAKLPAMFIRNRDGLAMKALLRDAPDSKVEMNFDEELSFLVDPDGVASFSSLGPGVEDSVKPDLAAVGEEVFTAAQSENKDGDVYGPKGFTVTQGTSFSAPMVAGAYAILKAARPGLRPDQYGSLLITSTDPFRDGTARKVQVSGAGRLNVFSALKARLVFDPPSLSFGKGTGNISKEQIIRVVNTGEAQMGWKVSIASDDNPKPVLEPESLLLGPGERGEVKVRLSGDLQAGEYQGYIVFEPQTTTGDPVQQHMAYWYGVPTGKPAMLSFIPSPPPDGAPGAVVNVTALITDAIGTPVPEEQPKVTVIEGSGTFIVANSLDDLFPGFWRFQLRLGATPGETNRFRIESGPVVREFSIRTR